MAALEEPVASGALDRIAIVGMAGRFPGAASVARFWENLCSGVDSISCFSHEELLAAGLSQEVIDDPRYVAAAGVLAGIELFDAGFFGFNPREAATIDPQQRLFLECAWEGLEDAGYDAELTSNAIGVYAGGSPNTYFLYHFFSPRDLLHATGGYQAMIGNDKDFLATRVSYKLNLQGPSLNVQTACSTSLVAVHLACQALLNGECDLAIAGGVSVRVPHRVGYLYQEGGILSPDGRCRAFDASARGTVPGSGVGVVVLKRLSATREGDTVRAVIRGSAVNNDGAVKVGYTAPGAAGQAAVIAEALAVAGVDAGTVEYLEAHGTGTPLGDSIELEALSEIYGSARPATGWCTLGSVKTNIGHLDAAAGIAGLIKAVLALQSRILPPNLHFERPNPRTRLPDGPFRVLTAAREWHPGPQPRRAAVSSFGIGGTNAHLVLEEAPPAVPTGPARSWHLLTLSARTPAALEAATDALAGHLACSQDLALADVAYTLQTGRRGFSHRRTVVCRDLATAAAALATRDAERLSSGMAESGDRPVVFLFSGQGSQRPAMGQELYAAEPAFRQSFDECALLLAPHLDLDLRDLLFGPGSDGAWADRTDLAQPALFAFEYALARLWMGWGVRPAAMLGHSLGEWVAACLGGVFALPEALELVAIRGRLMHGTPDGALLAVQLPAAALAPRLGELALAAVNGPGESVVSGPPAAIEEMARRLWAEGVAVRRLRGERAFHSRAMDEVVEAFAEAVRSRRPATPRIPFLSNLTGTWIREQEATDPGYWAAQLRGTVRFADGLAELFSDLRRVLLEIGPGGALAALARRQGPPQTVVLATLARSSAGGGAGEVESLLATLGRLWMAGVRVDWPCFHALGRRRRVPLPTYPFERRRHWIVAEAEAARDDGPAAAATAVDLHPRPALATAYVPPGSAVEKRLGDLWQELLGLDRIGVHDDFFDLGGHSLLATQLVSRLGDTFSVDIPLQRLFEAPTIARLADLVEEALVEKLEALSEEEAGQILG